MVWIGEGCRADQLFTKPVGQALYGYNVTRRPGFWIWGSMTLRLGASTILLALNVDIRISMKALGHSQIHVTINTCASVVPQLKRDATERIDSAFCG